MTLSWFSALVSFLGPAGTALLAVVTYLVALGTYKLLKEWLPF